MLALCLPSYSSRVVWHAVVAPMLVRCGFLLAIARHPCMLRYSMHAWYSPSHLSSYMTHPPSTHASTTPADPVLDRPPEVRDHTAQPQEEPVAAQAMTQRCRSDAAPDAAPDDSAMTQRHRRLGASVGSPDRDTTARVAHEGQRGAGRV